jgi:hypothetical protein
VEPERQPLLGYGKVNTQGHDLTGIRLYAAAEKKHVSAAAVTSRNNRAVEAVFTVRSLPFESAVGESSPEANKQRLA